MWFFGCFVVFNVCNSKKKNRKTMKTTAKYDILDGRFDYITLLMWHSQIEIWKCKEEIKKKLKSTKKKHSKQTSKANMFGAHS